MTKDGGQRIATSDGAMLADPDSLGNLPGVAPARIFEPKFWADRGELLEASRGRGSAWFITAASRHWVLRHFRRGGFIARFANDHYVWAGENRVRAFAEWRLLVDLRDRRLPVPTPVAARYQRSGIFYRCDLITQRIDGALPLSSMLELSGLSERTWRDIGVTVARFHAAGVDHADLNAHNILLDDCGAVSLIDFDRGRLRPPGSWMPRNLSRLRRSLAKVSRDLPPERFSAASWSSIVAGYASVPVRAPAK